MSNQQEYIISMLQINNVKQTGLCLHGAYSGIYSKTKNDVF